MRHMLKSTVILFLVWLHSISSAQTIKDKVYGNLIQLNDNGMWCWYQDERAVVDKEKGKLILGSVAYFGSQGGIGAGRNGTIEAVLFDLHSYASKRYRLAQFGCDDHNAPSFLVRPDGKYLAMYAQHYDAYYTRYRIFDGSNWSPEKRYDWTKKPGGTDYTICYNNIYYLSDENRVYDFARANHRAPNFLVSTDYGDTWTWGGQLTTNQSKTYNKGYYKYWSNGIDRIDFIFTEQHPRDTTTSIYHGYLQGGKAYRSDGTLVDDNIFDTNYIPTFKEFTKVFQEGTVIGKDTMRRCWQADVVMYDQNTIATLITARVNNNTQGNDTQINPDHHFIYCRYDGHSWTCHFLARAGKKLYASEADYTGLGALDPNDPNVVYISTPYSPIDTSAFLGVREIWKGTTEDQGKTWLWVPITENSLRDNLRPIVPFWDKENTTVLWCRGTYHTAQSFDAAIVGIIQRKGERVGQKTYVDADTVNTTLANELPFHYTGPSTGQGPMDNQWHIRIFSENHGNVLASAELIKGENAPMLKTHVHVPKPGTYDVWVNFWGSTSPSADWRIVAGFSPNAMQVYRSMACQTVKREDYETPPLLSSSGTNLFLYQAYIGRIKVGASNTFEVFVDDSAYTVGTTTLSGEKNRTWYDGVSYALVENETHVLTQNVHLPLQFQLDQNYPNPFNSTTTISFTLSRSDQVSLKVFNVLGQEVACLINEKLEKGTHRVLFEANHLPSGLYFYQIQTSDFVEKKKMLLLR